MVEQLRFDGVAAVYRRELPGGGYVAIGVEREQAEREFPRARVYLERRGQRDRRPGHAPIILAEAECDEHSPEFTELYQIAADNAAIARALLRLGTTHPERAD
jgi:hypothetical protein